METLELSSKIRLITHICQKSTCYKNLNADLKLKWHLSFQDKFCSYHFSLSFGSKTFMTLHGQKENKHKLDHYIYATLHVQ